MYVPPWKQLDDLVCAAVDDEWFSTTIRSAVMCAHYETCLDTNNFPSVKFEMSLLWISNMNSISVSCIYLHKSLIAVQQLSHTFLSWNYLISPLSTPGDLPLWLLGVFILQGDHLCSCVIMNSRNTTVLYYWELLCYVCWIWYCRLLIYHSQMLHAISYSTSLTDNEIS